MTTPEADLDSEFRQQVVDTMTTVLARLLDRPEPVTEEAHAADGGTRAQLHPRS